ncbi:uncharacterized protein LOC143253189 isoform X2 [Tachypleus tridentatus]|uniref:uncharacterized protein LOC143253189 isoform X2 n=1 Tax=Tachypleus tridentatus TaxID=6853 RepID=UPI003FD3ACFD
MKNLRKIFKHFYIRLEKSNEEYKLDSQNSSTHNNEEQVNSLRRPTIIKSKTDQLKRKEAPPRPPPPKSGPTSKSTNIFVKPATSQKNDYQAELETIYNTGKEINKNLDKSSFLKENDTVASSHVPKPAFHYSKKGHASLHFPRNVDDGITSSTFSGQDDHNLSVSGSYKSSFLADLSALSCLIPKPKTRTLYNQKEESQENLLDLSDTYNINEYSLLEGTNTKLQFPFHSGNVLPEKKLTTPRFSTCFPKDTSGSCASPCVKNNKNNESHLSHSNVAQLENHFPVSNIPRKVPNESKTLKLNVNSYQGVRTPVPISFESSSTVWQSSLDTKAKEERSLVQIVPSARTSTKEEKTFQHVSSLTIPQHPLPTMHNVHYGNLIRKYDFPENTMNSVTLRKCKAVYSFKGENPDELTFKEGDVIIFEEKINEDWWKGNLGDQQGIFPSSYVVMEGTDDFNSTNVNAREGLTTCIVVALYDFEEGDERDLSFKASIIFCV